MARLKTCYIVYDDAWGQRGCFIEEIKISSLEFREKQNTYPKNYFITDNYASALYYIQD